MNSSRPYLLRALYEWIVDNGCTPHIIVDAEIPRVDVPEQYVKDGQIVLNLSPTAVIELEMADESLSFNGRFGGQPVDIFIPMGAILGIYARENGQGMAFDQEEDVEPPDGPGDDPGNGPGDGNGHRDGGDNAPTPLRPNGGRPSLKVVK